jgi:hypothetical protein
LPTFQSVAAKSSNRAVRIIFDPPVSPGNADAQWEHADPTYESLWSAYFPVAVTATLYYSGAVFAEETEFLALVIGVSAVALAVSFPLFLALWRYAFRSPDVWSSRDAA